MWNIYSLKYLLQGLMYKIESGKGYFSAGCGSQVILKWSNREYENCSKYILQGLKCTTKLNVVGKKWSF